MIFIYAFLFSAVVCLIGQLILDNTNLTAGHITSLFVVIGSFLSFLGIYPILIEKCGGGATSLILNFGNALFEGGMNGYLENGFLGILNGILTKGGLAIVVSIILSFTFSLIFNPKD